MTHPMSRKDTTMYRYYVSFSHQAPTGLGIAAIDITTETRIVGAADITRINQFITRQGYHQVMVLAFSPYATIPHPTRRRPRSS